MPKDKNMTLWVLTGSVQAGAATVNAGKRATFAPADEIKLAKSSSCILLAGASPRVFASSSDANVPKIRVISVHGRGTSGVKATAAKSKKGNRLTLEFRKKTSRANSGADKDKRYAFKALIKL